MATQNNDLTLALASQTTQIGWGAKFVQLMSTSVRLRWKRDANASAVDPWSTGTEALNIGVALTYDSDTGEVLLGKLSGATVKNAIDLSTGSAVFRLESGIYSYQGTLGLSGKEMNMSFSPTATSGIVSVGASIKPPANLPINADGVVIGGKATDVVFQNTSGSAITDQQFTIGHVFKKGAIPSSNAAVALVGPSTVPVQMNVKATHSDGSVRHAVLSGSIPTLAANSSVTYDVQRVASSTPVPALPSDFPGMTAVITITEAGTVYTASLADLLSGSYKTWLSGSVVSEWYGIAPLKTSGGTVHPYITVRLHARAFKGKSKARISVKLENCSVVRAGTTPIRHCVYDLAISVGGTQVFTQSNVVHLPLTHARKIFWWGGAAPSVHVRHNTDYLIGTKAFPNYDSNIRGNTDLTRESGYMTQLNANRALFGSGVALKYMPNTGGRPDIGIMPGWDVMYLLGMNPTMREVSLTQADLMGSWTAHPRDVATDQPLSAIDQSNLAASPPYRFTVTNITPGTSTVITLSENHNFIVGMLAYVTDVVGSVPINFVALPITAVTANTITVSRDTSGGSYTSGGKVLAENPCTYESAHVPAEYFAYAMSGDLEHMEEMQFYAMAAGAGQLVHDRQLRAQAWGIRDFAHAAYITPDDDRLKSHFQQLVDLNIANYDSKYTNNSSANALGAVVGGSAWSDPDFAGTFVRPWQDDFITQTFGHLVELGFKNALPFFLYKTKFPISRMNYCRMLASPYTLKLRPTYPGDPYATLEQCQIGTYPANYPQQGNNILAQVFDSAEMGTQLAPVFYENSIAANSMMGNAATAFGYPANLQPALAFAVTLGANGASAMWTRFEGRSVKPTNEYRSEPTFAITPRI